MADIAEIRCGGLALGRPSVSTASGPTRAEVLYEVAFDKVHPTGTAERLAFLVTTSEALLLAPWFSPTLATTAPSLRPLLFPGLTASGMALWLTHFFHRLLPGHVFRRSAIRSAVSRGVPAWAIVAMTLHGSREGFLAYAPVPLSEVREAAVLFAE